MALDLQAISDRLEIQDLVTRYANAIDARDWDALDSVFTPDATIDYTESGGAKGRYPEIKAWLPTALGAFPAFQHLVGNTQAMIDGDTATARTMLFNPMVHRDAEGREQTFFMGLWYRDRLVRTADGWRISDRHEEASWTHNVPRLAPPPSL